MQVPAHQFVEHRVVFPRNLLTSTAGAQVRPGNALGRIVGEELASQREYADDQEKIDDAKEHPGRTILFLLLLGLGPALGLMALVWLFYGRELRTGYDREYEQAPPTDTEPALVPSLVKQETVPGSNEFTATLFDLIRRGRFKATPVTTERSVWGGLRHEDVADLHVTRGDGTVGTTAFEAARRARGRHRRRRRGTGAVGVSRRNRGRPRDEQRAVQGLQDERDEGDRGSRLVRGQGAGRRSA